MHSNRISSSSSCSVTRQLESEGNTRHTDGGREVGWRAMGESTRTRPGIGFLTPPLPIRLLFRSSLVLRFVKKQFFEYQESTIGGMHADRYDVYVRWHALGSAADPLSSMLPPPPSLSPAAFLTQTIQLNDAVVKFEIWVRSSTRYAIIMHSSDLLFLIPVVCDSLLLV